jgi:elongation factor G
VGRKFSKLDEATAGQIVALEKIDYLETHHTISDLSAGFHLKPIVRPEPQISLAVVAKERGAEDKIAEALTKMRQEDANISFQVVKDTKQLVLSGMGQFHLEILKKKIERKYNVTFDLEPPRVTYKEAFKKTVEAQGKYKKQTGGHGQYGDCWIKVIPTARETGFEFLDEVKGGAIPRNFIPSVEKGVREAMEQGFIAGYPIIDFKAAVYDGSYHDVDSSDMAFKVAGSMAFKKCMETANVVLLEPIMEVEIRISLDYMGAIIQDLNSRRGRVLGMEAQGDQQVIKALVPQAEMLTYDNTLQGITQGSGYFTMRQKAYEEAPPPVANKVIDAYKRTKEQQQAS